MVLRSKPVPEAKFKRQGYERQKWLFESILIKLWTAKSTAKKWGAPDENNNEPRLQPQDFKVHNIFEITKATEAITGQVQQQ